MTDSITITDNRTGETIEIPLVDGTVSAKAWSALLPGIWFDDPSFSATSGADSAITYLDGEAGLLRYRGYPIEQLAEQTTFLEVAHLLVRDELPTAPQLKAWQSEIAEAAPIHENFHKRILEGFRDDAHAMGVLVSSIAAMSTFWPDSKDIQNPEQRRAETTRLIAKMPTLAASAQRRSAGLPYVLPDPELDYTSNFLSMMFRTGDAPYEVDPVLRDALDMLFVLHADHEQNCSTTTARVVGSAHADPYVTVAAAAGALYGPRHGGANEAVLHMLEEIAEFDNVGDFIAGVKTGERKLMGFGHRVYKAVDPRSIHLQDDAKALGERKGQPKWFSILQEVIEVMQPYSKRGICQNVDFFSGTIYYLMGIPDDLFISIFAMGRIPGWTVQVMEQLENNILLRPRLAYVGDMDNEYVPIEERG